MSFDTSILEVGGSEIMEVGGVFCGEGDGEANVCGRGDEELMFVIF